ncbi:MAG: hypothetical protein ACXVBW_01880 [Bdellovibrionota bacterium]
MAAHSPQFANPSSYTPWGTEPHSVGPTWESAARHEWFFRCARNYASGDASCTSYSALTDSAFVRAASWVTGHSPPLTDPEFQDPLLGWLLVLKKGVLAAALVAAGCFALMRADGFPGFALLVGVLFAISPQLASTGFELSSDNEMGTAIFFFTALLLASELKPRRRSSEIAQGIGYGILATIKLPVGVFALMTIRTRRTLFAFLVTILALCAGVLATSSELQTLRLSLSSTNTPLGPDMTLARLLARNLGFVFRDLLWIAPFSALGYLLVAFRAVKSLSWRHGLLIALTWKFASATNSYPRFFVGLTGIALALAWVASEWLRERLEQDRPRGRRTLDLAVYATAGVIGAMTLTTDLAPLRLATGHLANYFRTGATSPEAGEKLVLAELNNGSEVYVDLRARVHASGSDFDEHRSQLHFVDLLNEWTKVPAGSTLVTFCYDPEAPETYGLASWGALAEIFRARCPRSERIAAERLIRFQNERTLPVAHSQMISFQMPEKPQVQPILAEREVRLDTGLFRIQGPYIQEWQSSVTNLGMIPIEPLVLEKRLKIAKGNHRFNLGLDSNFRRPGNQLEWEIDGNKQGACDLNTREALRSTSRINRFLDRIPGYATWRDKYFPVSCEITVQAPFPRTIDLRFRILSNEVNGRARFHELAITPFSRP